METILIFLSVGYALFVIIVSTRTILKTRKISEVNKMTRDDDELENPLDGEWHEIPQKPIKKEKNWLYREEN